MFKIPFSILPKLEISIGLEKNCKMLTHFLLKYFRTKEWLTCFQMEMFVIG